MIFNNQLAKVMRRSLCLSLGFACPVAMAEPSGKESPELVALKAAYQTQIEAAKKSVDVRYKERLEELLKTETQKGDLDGVVAVRDELAKIGTPLVMPVSSPLKDSPFVGVVWGRRDHPDLKIEFRADGTWSGGPADTSLGPRTWRTTLEPNLIILGNWSPKDPQMPFLMMNNGKECMRSVDGYKYQKRDAGQPPPEKPADPAKPSDGGFHPFGTVK